MFNFNLSVKIYRSIDFKYGIVKVVDKILTDGYSKDLNNNLNEIIYSGYSLSSTEIETIEQNTAK